MDNRPFVGYNAYKNAGTVIFTELYMIFTAVMSIAAFICYGIDKHRARRGSRRLDESLLIGLGLLGGAPGALIAMKVFRHKTRHRRFWVVNFAALTVYLTLFIHIVLKTGFINSVF